MANYTQLYDTGLPYYSEEVKKVIQALEHSQCVTLCSVYKMGDRRFVDYINYLIAHDDRFDVYYDLENSFTAADLQRIQKKQSNRVKVVLLPWFFRMSPEFVKEYTSIMRDKRNTFVSVIILEASFLDHPEKVFSDSNVPMEIVITRKPFAKAQTNQFLDIRCALAETTLSSTQREQITKLSGGHIGLTKRLFQLASQGSKVTLNTALQDPTVKTDLLNLELQYRTLSQQTCRAIGLLRKDNTCAIPLLRHFITTINGTVTDTLSPLYQKLLELFLEKNGELVTKEEIHTIMNEEQEYSMWAVYKSISRFSKAIAKKYIVKNVNGKGYMLIHLEKDDRLH